MNLTFYGKSIINERQENMDSLFIKKINIKDSKALIVVVCDGVGSLELGGYASNKTALMLKQWFESLNDSYGIGLKLINKVKEINDFINLNINNIKVCSATTLTAALFVNNKMYCVHVGDSRLYIYDFKALVQLTKDDVNNKKLNGYIGKKNNINIQYYEEDIKEFTLLCTDGINKTISDLEILNIVKNSKRKEKKIINNLINKAIYNGETDNITCAVVRKK